MTLRAFTSFKILSFTLKTIPIPPLKPSFNISYLPAKIAPFFKVLSMVSTFRVVFMPLNVPGPLSNASVSGRSFPQWTHFVALSGFRVLHSGHIINPSGDIMPAVNFSIPRQSGTSPPCQR